MSGIVNKVKEALHSGSSTHSGQPEGTHGHHSSRTANAADPRIDSDRDHRAAPATGAHDGSYTASDNYTYGSNNRGVDGPATRTDGPHSANIANQVDPRIDSDRDHSRNVGMNPSGTATTGTHTGTTGTSGLHSSTGTHTGTHAPGPAPNTAGPHKSDMMNKLNPTVDSDLDGSRNMGLNSNNSTTTGARTGTTGTTGLGSSTHGTHTGTTGTTGLGSSTHGTHTGTTGLGSSTHGTHTGTTGLHSSTGTNTTAGPHKSDMMNKADPRVDSDLDRSRNMGLNSNTTHGTHTGTTGTTGLGSSTHGTHTGTTGTAGGKPAVGGFGTGSNTHSTTHGTTHGTTTGVTGTHAPGPAPNTAGPHKSDMMNKIDPRVDSDMDGSKTYGGDKTYTRS